MDAVEAERKVMHDQEILPVPDHIKPFRTNKETVCIDKEIVQPITALWKCGVVTLGSCQGDPDNPDLPRSVIVSSEYGDEILTAITRVLLVADNATWHILQWQSPSDPDAEDELICVRKT